MEPSLADIQLDDIDEDLLQLLDTVENYVLNVDHEEEEEEEEFAQIDASNYLNEKLWVLWSFSQLNLVIFNLIWIILHNIGLISHEFCINYL